MPVDDGKVEKLLGAEQGADELNPQELESISGSLPPGVGIGIGGGAGHLAGGTIPSCVATTDTTMMGCVNSGDG